jgi:hypothetical protein
MKNHVSAEARGLSRLFRQQVDVADAAHMASIRRLSRPLFERLARKPGLRPSMAIDVARAWQALQNPYRFDFAAEAPQRGHLVIADCFLGAAFDKESHWDDYEDSIGIKLVTLDTAKPRFTVDTEMLATISLHAVARWHERSGSRDHTRLIADLRAIIIATHPHRVTLDGGEWRGSIINATDGHDRKIVIRNVRTFISGDQIDQPHAAEPPPRAA